MQKHPSLPQAFADLGIEVRFLKALHKMGFVEPTEIQKGLLPVILEGKDVLGQARTGTGKTAAFGLPLLQKCEAGGRMQVLCLVPTRELAVQVAAEVQRLCEFADLRCVPVYGGQKISAQLHALGKKPHFVVGTPGRVFDLYQRRALPFDGIRAVVLDEVDRMLDIGFRDDIRDILQRIRQPHQNVFVSATLETDVKRLAREFAPHAVEVNVSRDEIVVSEVEQCYCTVDDRDKFRLLEVILKQENPDLAIIFTNTKHKARKLAKRLFEIGVDAKEIHGDLIQSKRDRVMASFRKHKFRVLVATDLAARGIDVQAITHIINFDIPEDKEVYVHRIGRTARMGAVGKAITFVNQEEGKELTQIEMLINVMIPERKFEGFTPRVFDDTPRPSVPATASRPTRSQQSVFSPAAVAQPGVPSVLPPSKTLGGKFRPRRRRRL